MGEFKEFQQAVVNQFKTMDKDNLYMVDIDKDKLWDVYLISFPEGSNKMYKERTEHDCQCCRQFIRVAGGFSINKR